jgi:uncharacterized protein YcnI
MRKRVIAGAAMLAVAAGIALLSMPAGAGAHATVSPFQPQTPPLTAARTLYVLRVPNEEESLVTYKVVLPVPAALQEAISVKAAPGWRTRLTRKWTGKTEKFGNEVVKIYGTSKITWIAKRREGIRPGFFDDFFLRFQNPSQAQQICFPVFQYYGTARRSGKFKLAKTVNWNGPPNSEAPASCVNILGTP